MLGITLTDYGYSLAFKRGVVIPTAEHVTVFSWYVVGRVHAALGIIVSDNRTVFRVVICRIVTQKNTAVCVKVNYRWVYNPLCIYVYGRGLACADNSYLFSLKFRVIIPAVEDKSEFHRIYTAYIRTALNINQRIGFGHRTALSIINYAVTCAVLFKELAFDNSYVINRYCTVSSGSAHIQEVVLGNFLPFKKGCGLSVSLFLRRLCDFRNFRGRRRENVTVFVKDTYSTLSEINCNTQSLTRLGDSRCTNVRTVKNNLARRTLYFEHTKRTELA